MHLGNIYSALLSWLSARSQGGTWVLRIEDLDPQRSRREFVDQCEDDLRWLGLTWEERYVQSERFDIYRKYLEQLKEMHLTYPCYCTRADILATQAPHESDGRVVYKGTCKSLSIPYTKGGDYREINGRKPATRLIVPNKEIRYTDLHYGEQSLNLAEHCGDFILQRADGAWAYQLAVVVDDALMGVTEVVRGRDLLQSVPQQLYLYETLGLKAPSFCHLPLLCNEQKQRLCKRDKSLDLGELRREHSAEQIIGLLAYYAGIIERPEAVSAHELTGEFSWEKVPTEDIIVHSALQ